MTKLNSNVCEQFKQRINREIAAGEYALDHILKAALQSDKIKPEGKKAIGVDESVDLTMFDVTKDAYDILPKMRFIYLSSLMEAFFEEYIAERESIAIDQVKASIKAESSAWDKQNGGSKSFYNLAFVFFVINQKYSIDPSASIKPLTLESGDLRNCIVHDAGVLKTQYFVNQLKETITFLGANNVVGETLHITK